MLSTVHSPQATTPNKLSILYHPLFSPPRRMPRTCHDALVELFVYIPTAKRYCETHHTLSHTHTKPEPEYRICTGRVTAPHPFDSPSAASRSIIASTTPCASRHTACQPTAAARGYRVLFCTKHSNAQRMPVLARVWPRRVRPNTWTCPCAHSYTLGTSTA